MVAAWIADQKDANSNLSFSFFNCLLVFHKKDNSYYIILLQDYVHALLVLLMHLFLIALPVVSGPATVL